jgi:hypothetical protein
MSPRLDALLVPEEGAVGLVVVEADLVRLMQHPQLPENHTSKPSKTIHANIARGVANGSGAQKPIWLKNMLLEQDVPMYRMLPKLLKLPKLPRLRWWGAVAQHHLLIPW